jgi:hypothetical protein
MAGRLKEAVLGKLAAEGLSIRSDWSAIEACLLRTVAPTHCLRAARELRDGELATLTATSPEILAFLRAWHENGRARFERDCGSLVYDEYAPKTAKERRKYIALDEGRSGRFLVDKATGVVFTIKAYGTTNRRIGTLAELTAQFDVGTASYREVR